MGYRRQAREAAMSFLYQNDYRLPSRTADPRKFAQHFGVPDKYLEFFMNIVSGVQETQPEIDQKIESVAEHWKLYRMERIDRAILRLATWELQMAMETPYRVILDEAVEIAKKFSTTESASFVNGILDRLSQKLRPEERDESFDEQKDLVPLKHSQ